MAAPHLGRCLACGALLALLAGCGGGDGGSADRPDLSVTPTLPSATRTLPSPTRTVASPTRTATATTEPTDETTTEPTDEPTDEATDTPSTGPTEPPQETDSDVPVESPTRTQRPTESVAPTPTETTSISTSSPAAADTASPTPAEPTPSATPTESTAAGDADSSDEGTPAWVWWALAAVLVAAGLLAWLLLARARGRRARQEELVAAEVEVAWLARDLLPQLRSTGSLEQAAGGWQVAAPRVAAAEDRLTALAADTKDPAVAERARTLRDAVRDSRARVETLTRGGGTPDRWTLDLDDAITGLESALAHPEETP